MKMLGRPFGSFRSASGAAVDRIIWHVLTARWSRSLAGQMTLDEITGGSPYGITTIAGGDGSRMLSDNELEGAHFQGRHVADIATRLFPKQS